MNELSPVVGLLVRHLETFLLVFVRLSHPCWAIARCRSRIAPGWRS